ncbi:PRC-barrel domain-containing protein [Ensifer sp. ZNC0028]|uniref:PRC-barrel domain-containing protein n=1 Tax=unclassified Ensifer TaxID=2633371 RepID=UPI0005BABB9C|nr:PRC-barrel domain-containing protein [Ensifer sp. ZNC0028]
MIKKLVTTVAAGALFAGLTVAPVAFAQDATKPMDQPQTMQPAQPAPDATAPADQAETKPPITETKPADMAQSNATYLTEQESDQIAASTYIGQSVYNAGDESIGEINDLIMKKDGGVEAAVIGVGGFLGLGEKDVAVPFDRITIAEQPNTDKLKLTTTETADTLKAAPEFKTKSQKIAEQNANQPVDTSTTSSTSTAPAPAQPQQ